LAKAFEFHRERPWEAMHDRLRWLLSMEDYKLAERSTATSFYTAPAVAAVLFRRRSLLGVRPLGPTLPVSLGDAVARARLLTTSSRPRPSSAWSTATSGP
jgi:hypothetical protein